MAWRCHHRLLNPLTSKTAIVRSTTESLQCSVTMARAARARLIRLRARLMREVSMSIGGAIAGSARRAEDMGGAPLPTCKGDANCLPAPVGDRVSALYPAWRPINPHPPESRVTRSALLLSQTSQAGEYNTPTTFSNRESGRNGLVRTAQRSPAPSGWSISARPVISTIGTSGLLALWARNSSIASRPSAASMTRVCDPDRHAPTRLELYFAATGISSVTRRIPPYAPTPCSSMSKPTNSSSSETRMPSVASSALKMMALPSTQNTPMTATPIN